MAGKAGTDRHLIYMAVRFTSPYSHSVSSTHPVTLRDEGDMHRALLVIRVPLHSLTLLIESLLDLNSC